MTRILIVVAIMLMLAVGLQQARIQSISEAKAQAEEQLVQAATTNDELNATIADLMRERDRLQRMATDYAARRDRAAYERDQARQRLEELSRENKKLREYLDSPIPVPVVGWMWLRSEADHQNGNGKASASGLSAQGDANTAVASFVTHERGWQWCWDVRAALKSCNADKAAIRQWMDEQ